MKKRALITGVTGQDGSYLAELLLAKGYLVYGLERRKSVNGHERIAHLGNFRNFFLVEGDVTDGQRMMRVVSDVQPDEVYHLAAQSFVGASFEVPATTLTINGVGTANVLASVLSNRRACRFYQASSSEQFGTPEISPQDETTPFKPRSPYGVSKVAAHHLVVNAREAYDLHASCGILFNHESPRRGVEFVTRKIADHARRWQDGNRTPLKLGNVETSRDWGHARDYVYAMWMMLQQDAPNDYVIATGKSRKVREFVELSVEHLFGKQLTWEFGMETDPWRAYLGNELYAESDRELYRPSEIVALCGNAEKARRRLGWRPTRSLENIVGEMCGSTTEEHRRKAG